MPGFGFWFPDAKQAMESPGMVTKFALLALALFAAWMLLFRATRGITGTKRNPPVPPAQELAPCPRCGVFRLPAGACDCDPPVAPPG
jgi:hypothetical protein